MKVLLVNGSPHREGCTYTALCAVSEALNQNGIDTDTFWIGNKPISGCIACHKCNDRNRCVFEDTVNDFWYWQRIMMALYLEHRSTGQELPVQSLLFWTVLFMPI